MTSGALVIISSGLALARPLAPDLIRICAAAPNSVQRNTRATDWRALKWNDLWSDAGVVMTKLRRSRMDDP